MAILDDRLWITFNLKIMKEKTISEVARMGGLATLKKYGNEHFIKLALEREEKKRIDKIREQIRKDKSKL